MEKYRLLFESVFKKKLTDDDTVSYLKRLTAEHPYFSVAQFYLLQLSESGTSAYKAQAKKTATLFNNNYWLNFQLLEAGNGNDASPKTSPLFDAATVAETVIEQPVEPAITDAVSVGEKIAEEIKEEKSGATEPVVVNEPATTNEIQNQDENSLPEEPVTEINEVSGMEVINAVKEETLDSAVVEALPESEPVIEETAQAQTEEKNIKNEVAAKLSDEPLLFEPLHTTDYFASLGIKLSEEEKSSGKLGKQLKSFTEWLKTMKKVHTEQLVQTTGPAAVEAAASESTIQKLAEKSNEDDQVITEAMAEVLLQQGKEEKAVEILEKLSLLNPGKSTYFAAKINQIKEK